MTDKIIAAWRQMEATMPPEIRSNPMAIQVAQLAFFAGAQIVATDILQGGYPMEILAEIDLFKKRFETEMRVLMASAIKKGAN